MTQEKKKPHPDKDSSHSDGHERDKAHHSDTSTKHLQQQHAKEAHQLAEAKAAKARAEEAHAAALRKAEARHQEEIRERAASLEKQKQEKQKQEQQKRQQEIEEQHKAAEAKLLAHHNSACLLKPEDRSKAKIREYKDEHGIQFKYDDHGRITEKHGKDGCLTVITYGGDGKAHGFEMRNQKNKLLAHVGDTKVTQKDNHKDNHKDNQKDNQKEQIEVNQADSTIKVITDNKDQHARYARSVSHYRADNKIETEQLDHHNRALVKTVSEPGEKGAKLLKRTEFQYSDHSGRMTNNESQIDDKKPVFSVVKDAHEKITDKYQFSDAHCAQTNKATLHEHIDYAVDASKHQIQEVHTAFDLRGKQPELISTVHTTFNTKSGETTVDTRLNNGTEQHAKFDAAGKTLELSHQEAQHKFVYNLVNGAIQGVSDNGKAVVAGAELNSLVQAGNCAIASNLKTISLAKNESGDLSNKLNEAGVRQGSKPSGTLVWSDNGTLHQAKVKDGQFTYKDKSGHVQQGAVSEDGSFNIGGKKANIKDQAEGSAFHGVGSDGTPLDISCDKDKEGFNGILKDGRSAGNPSYRIVNSNIYGKDGSFKGHLGADGMVVTPEGGSATRVNSLDDGFTFEGTENGKHRTFVCNDQAPMSSGKMFIQGQHGPEEYEVRMGMIINKKTGLQLGILIPPVVQGETMNGGSVWRTDTHPPRNQNLCNFKNAVFDIDLSEQKGAFGTSKIRGACLGAEEHDLGGHLIGGGLFNVQAAIDTQNNSIAASQQKEQANSGFHASLDWISGAQGDLANAARTDERSSQMVLDSLNQMMQTGRVHASTLSQFGAITSNTKVDLLGGDDSIAGQRFLIDQAKPQMEKLPTDSKQLNGSVVIVNTSSPHGHDQLQIRNGIVYGTDNKSQIARIDGADGHLTMIDPVTKKLVPGDMQSLTGAVWHFNWKDGHAQEQKADFVSLGNNQGLVSIAALRKQAHKETEAAITANNESNSDESKALLDDTRNAELQFNRRLDRILQKGTEGADVGYLVRGAGNVRMDASSPDDPPPEAPRQKLEIPTIQTAKDAQSTNGKLRIDNHVYKIDHGQLFELTSDNGHETVSHKSAGTLQAGYNVQFVGGENINLANHHRVLMQFTIGSSSEVHQIIGLGPAHNTDSFGQTDGGLVPVQDLYKQADEAAAKARQGDVEYFQNRPYITGNFANFEMGNREQCLADFAKSIDSQSQRLKESTNDLFTNGFDVTKVKNNKLDGAINLTQLMVNDIGSDACSSASLAQDGRQVQKMTNDAFVMAAETVATAGLGEAFTIAKNAKNLSTMVALGAEASSDVLVCGMISGVGRASGNASLKDNVYSGMVEGGTMALGSIGAKAFGNMAQLQKTEQLAAAVRGGSVAMEDLAPAERALLSSGIGQMAMSGRSAAYIKSVNILFKMSDSVAQTTGFNIAGNIREHNWDSMNAKSIVLGSSAMLFGQVVGKGFAGSAEKYIGLSEDGLGGQIVNGMASSYSNGAAGAVDGALDKERERIAEQMHISKDLVSTSMLYKYINWNDVVGYVNEAGLQSALSSPLMTVGSHKLTESLRESFAAQEHMTAPSNSSEFDPADNTTLPRYSPSDSHARNHESDVPQLLGRLRQSAEGDQAHENDTNRNTTDSSTNPHHSETFFQEFNSAANHLKSINQPDLAHGFVAAADLVAMEPHGNLSLNSRLRIAGELRRNAERYQELGQHDLASGYEAAADSMVPDHRAPVEHVPVVPVVSQIAPAVTVASEAAPGQVAQVAQVAPDEAARTHDLSQSDSRQNQPELAVAENRSATDQLKKTSDSTLRTLASSDLASEPVLNSVVDDLARTLKDLPQPDAAQALALKQSAEKLETEYSLARQQIAKDNDNQPISPEEMANSAYMRERVRDNPALQAIYENYLAARQEHAALVQAYYAPADEVKEKIQGVLDAFVRRTNETQNGETILPPITLSKSDLQQDGISAVYTPGQGTISLQTSALRNPEEYSRLVASIMHETGHAEQDALIVRRIADQVAPDTTNTLSQSQLKDVANRYEQVMHRKATNEFIEGVLAARKGQLNDEQGSRADALMQSLGNPKSADLSKFENHLRVVTKELSRLQTTESGYESFSDLANNPARTRQLYNNDQAPEVVQLLIEKYKATGADPTRGWDSAAARETLIDSLQQVKSQVARERIDAYERYRAQPHEQESFALGELALRRAREDGLSTPGNKSSDAAASADISDGVLASNATSPDGVAEREEPSSTPASYDADLTALKKGNMGSIEAERLFGNIQGHLTEDDFVALAQSQASGALTERILSLGLAGVLKGKYDAKAAAECIRMVSILDRRISVPEKTPILKVLEHVPDSELAKVRNLNRLAKDLVTSTSLATIPAPRQAEVLFKFMQASKNRSDVEIAGLCLQHFPVDCCFDLIDRSDQAYLTSVLESRYTEKMPMRDAVRSLVNKLAPASFSERAYEHLLTGIPAEDRPLANQYLVDRADFLTSAGVEKILRSVYDQLGEQGNLVISKHIRSTRYVPKITAVCASTASEGSALAYLFRKFTNVNVDLKVIEPGALPADLRNVVLFDSPTKLFAKSELTPEQLKERFKQQNILSPEELVGSLDGSRKGFADGLNFLDIATAQARTRTAENQAASEQSMTTAQTKLKDAVDAMQSGGTVNTYPDFAAVKEAISQPVNDKKTRQEIGALMYFEQKQMGSVRDERLLAHLLTVMPKFITYADMIDQCRELHQTFSRQLDTEPEKAIFDAQGNLNANVRFVTLKDSDGTTSSSDLITRLYREANNLTDAKFDKNFVEFAALKNGDAKGKVVIGLDDYIYSGGHAEKLMKKLLALTGKGKDPSTIVLAHLGAYEEGATRARNYQSDSSTYPIVLINGNENDYKSLTHESQVGELARTIAPDLLTYRETPEQVAAGMLRGAKPNFGKKDPVSIALEYMAANNNLSEFYDILTKYMRVPGTSNKDTSKHADTVKEAANLKADFVKSLSTGEQLWGSLRNEDGYSQVVLEDTLQGFAAAHPDFLGLKGIGSAEQIVIGFGPELESRIKRDGEKIVVTIPQKLAGPKQLAQAGDELYLALTNLDAREASLQARADTTERKEQQQRFSEVRQLLDQAQQDCLDYQVPMPTSLESQDGEFSTVLSLSMDALKASGKPISEQQFERLAQFASALGDPGAVGHDTAKKFFQHYLLEPRLDELGRSLGSLQENTPLTAAMLLTDLSELKGRVDLSPAEIAANLRERAATLRALGKEVEAKTYLAAADNIMPEVAASYTPTDLYQFGPESENNRETPETTQTTQTTQNQAIVLGPSGLIQSTTNSGGVQWHYTWEVNNGQAEIVSVQDNGHSSLQRQPDGSWLNRLGKGPYHFEGLVAVDEFGNLTLKTEDKGSITFGLDNTTTERAESGAIMVSNADRMPVSMTSVGGRTTSVVYDNENEPEYIKFLDGRIIVRDSVNPRLWLASDANGEHPWTGGVAIYSSGVITTVSGNAGDSDRVTSTYDCLDDSVQNYRSADMSQYSSTKYLEGGSTRVTKYDSRSNAVTLTKSASGQYEQIQNDRFQLDLSYENKELNSVKFHTGTLVKRDSGTWDFIREGDKRGKPFASEVTLDESGNLMVKPINMRDSLTRQSIEQLSYLASGNVTRDYAAPTYKDEATVALEPRDFAPKPANFTEHVRSLFKADAPPPPLKQAQFTVKTDDADRIIEGTNRAGDSYHIDYSPVGDPVRLRLNYSQNLSGERRLSSEAYVKNGDIWAREESTTNPHKISGVAAVAPQLTHFAVEPNGSLTLHDGSNGARLLNPEGCWTEINELGYESMGATATDARMQQEVLRSLFQQGTAETARSERFDTFLETFEHRLYQQGGTPFDAANSYLSMRRMLEAPDALLPLKVRLRLAEQLAYNLAFPEKIDQGNHPTCNVTAEVEARFFAKYPHIATQIITDVAATGRNIMPDGTIVDLRYVEGALTPQSDALESLNLPYVRNGSDISPDGGRSYADQLFQIAAINSYWQSQSFDPQGQPCRRASTVYDVDDGLPYHPGDVRYEYVAPLNIVGRPGADPRDVLRIHSADGTRTARSWSDSAPLIDPLLKEKVGEQNFYLGPRLECPDLGDTALIELSAKMLGFDEETHYLTAGAASENMKRIDSAEDLKDALLDMQAASVLPVTVRVDTRNPPFNHATVATPDGRGGGHVVLVHKIFQDVDGDWNLQFSNQWGDSNNFMPGSLNPRGDSYPLKDFYLAMQSYGYQPPSLDKFDRIEIVKNRVKSATNAVYRAVGDRIKNIRRTLGS